MADKTPSRAETTSGPLPYFLRAVMAELQRVVERDRDEWTVKTHLPVVPHAGQLGMLGLWLLKGVNAGHGELAAHRDKLEGLLEKAYRKSMSVWADAMKKSTPKARDRLLNDSKMIHASVMKAVRFADRKFGLYETRLNHFTDHVQDTLAQLVGKVSEAVELKIRPGLTGEGAAGESTPTAVYAAVTLGVLAGGLAGRREMTPKELSVARIACRLGVKKDKAGGPEPKSVKQVRRALKQLAEHLPEQRA